jgi:DNA-binding protein H-NS
MATYKELLAQRDELNERISQLRNAERSSAFEEICRKMTDYNINIGEIVDGRWLNTRKSSTCPPAAAMYRDPRTGKELSGRCRAPDWIKHAVDRTPFLIKKMTDDVYLDKTELSWA